MVQRREDETLSNGKPLLCKANAPRTRLLPIHPSTHPRSFLSPIPLLLIILLCLSLTGCGFFHPGPPKAVVEKAVAQKLVQTQELLRSQLASGGDAPKPLAVGQVKVSSKGSVTVGGQSAIEVQGTYTLKGGDLSRAQRQQSRPFDLYMQPGSDEDPWRLLEPDFAGVDQQPRWQFTPLP